MEEEQNNIPELRSFDQMIFEELRPYWLDPTKEYPEPHFLFEYNGVGFSPLGGIQAISGQKKNGKTFVLSLLMAASLGTGTERVTEYLGSLRTKKETIEWLGHNPVVLYCDTEMEQLNTAKVLRRVHWLCGWEMRERNDRFHVLWLREVPKSEKESSNHERWRLIKNGIEAVNPDVVFIDGLRDLVNDFNDNAESSEIVSEMMSIASQNDMCIWTVLHMNPRPSNDDESKMRGHLGTELGNKVSDTFVSIKKKDPNTGAVTFSVKQQDARGKDIEDWTFEITDDCGNLGIPKITSKSPLQNIIQQAKEENEIMEQETVRVLKEIISPPMSKTFTECKKLLKQMLGVGEPKAIKYWNQIKENYPGLLYRRSDGKFTINLKELEQYEKGLPF